MIKKLLTLCFIAYSFNMNAMNATRENRSPLNQVMTILPSEETPVIKPKIYRFPQNYNQLRFISKNEWEQLPPYEQDQWVQEFFTPDQEADQNNPFAKPLSVSLGLLIRIEVMQNRLKKYQESMGYVDTTKLNGGNS